MNQRAIGTCSICSAAVTVPAIWGGVVPPTPTCSSCGAVPAEPHGPVIPMKPAPVRRWTFANLPQPTDDPSPPPGGVLVVSSGGRPLRPQTQAALLEVAQTCMRAIASGRVEQPPLTITVDRYSCVDAILGLAMAARQPIEGDLADAYSPTGLVWITAAEDEGDGRVAYTIRSTP